MAMIMGTHKIQAGHPASALISLNFSARMLANVRAGES
jgi:hypothetical protein